MKILLIVTLVTPTGDYGGPVRVALNQARALAERGHEVLVVGGARGYDVIPDRVDGVPVRLFPVRTVLPGAGFAGLASPALRRWVQRNVSRYDAVHVHMARDLVTLPAARAVHRAGVPFVVQSHGMIDPSSNPLALPLDAVLTRPLLRAARAVFYLTPRERGELQAVAGTDLALRELRNGVPPADPAPATDHEVLFLARLAPRKRPLHFVRLARDLAAEFPETRFALVGPDEGEGDQVRRDIDAADLGDRLVWEGPVNPDDAIERMRRASVYVLPAVDEPYPMSVLEAMSLGLPVVITESCGLAPIVQDSGGGYVTDASYDDLLRATRALLADPAGAAARGRAGRSAAAELLGMGPVVEALESAYSGG